MLTGRSVFLVALVAVAVGAAALQVASHRLEGLTSLTSSDTRSHRSAESHHPKTPAAEAPSGSRLAQDARSDAAHLAGLAWRAARIPLALALILALAALVSRARERRTRRYVRLDLIPHRADEADPEQVRRLLEAWHQQLLERWWRRLPFGQRSLACELVMERAANGELEARLTIVCPEALVGAIEGGLHASYTNGRLVRDERAIPDLPAVVRLKKRYSFIRALHSPVITRVTDDRLRFTYERHLVDAVLNQMATLGDEAVVQYVLTPAPAIFERRARRLFSSVERRSTRAGARAPDQPGLASEVLGKELQGGLRVQHRPLFFTEIRVTAPSYRAAATLAATIRGESGAENRLVERHQRPWARAPLYRRRMQLAWGNPLPSWRRGVLSSLELAGLWQLPSPGLQSVRLDRSAVPRALAPPAISRAPEYELARDEHGAVGILPQDRTDGLGLIGGQKTGKTSVLCRTVRADAADPDCAVVVLMPKPGDAVKALSMVPRERTVHYLDFERPEFGINPLLAPGDPAMVADKIVQAFRDVNAEGDIRGSSDRYLRQAAQATIGASRSGVIAGPPTLWHMYRMLMPAETAFREHVVRAIYGDPGFTDSATFFGRELPSDLRDAPGTTVTKLDAPRNKLLRLMVESLDKVLRHPLQLSLDDLVRKREVLIVDGKMGTFGSDNCRVMMQFILNTLYGALQRQQQLPEHERVRVTLKVDEAHLILNESFADALATLRSAGLEVVAAWQYGDQIQDPKIRSGMLSLLRQRCMFSMGESRDARELSEIAMAVYSDVIRADPESRSRAAMTPDTIYNLPNHHAVCSWISKGAREPAFVARTIPLENDPAVVQHHLDAQRARGCHVPPRLPDPLPDVDGQQPRALPTGVAAEPAPAAAGNGAPGGEGARGGAEGASGNGHREDGARALPADVELAFSPAATDVGPPATRARPRRGAPDSYVELDLDDVRGIGWDSVEPVPPDRRHDPTHRELEILAALWSYRVLFANQLWRRWWPGSTLRSSQQGLTRMAKAGWIRRFSFKRSERGAQQRVYCLTKDGFELAQGRLGRHGNYIDPEATWREPQLRDPRRVLRDLHVNGWVLALERLAPRVVRSWRGPREGRLLPPRRRVRGEWVDLTPDAVEPGGNRRLRDLGTAPFEPVSPDATVEVRLALPEAPLRFDLLVELERAASTGAREAKLRRYDALITGWARTLDRYRTLGTPPVVVFVCEDEPSAERLLRLADAVVTGRVAKAGQDESEWPSPAREAMFFAAERAVHEGSLEALQLPQHPPDVRARLGRRGDRRCSPRRVEIVDPRLLRLR